jgi:ABC-type cobalamin/Fe3+-siderophores transport system ATPase subunit
MNKKKDKIKKDKLPNKILCISNDDKAFHEKWTETRNALNIPHPFRGVLLGPPNSGKSTIAKNILLRQNPPFKEVVIIHCDSEYTKEYDDLGESVKLLSSIPAPEEWEGIEKTLVILDDLEFKGMSKDQKRNLDRLVGYVSTHKQISVLLCAQDAFQVPPIVRRCSNLFILWKSHDLDSMAIVARKSGLTSNELKELFKLCKDKKDSIWIDMTDKTPYPLRLNGYELIKNND